MGKTIGCLIAWESQRYRS